MLITWFYRRRGGKTPAGSYVVSPLGNAVDDVPPPPRPGAVPKPQPGIIGVDVSNGAGPAFAGQGEAGDRRERLGGVTAAGAAGEARVVGSNAVAPGFTTNAAVDVAMSLYDMIVVDPPVIGDATGAAALGIDAATNPGIGAFAPAIPEASPTSVTSGTNIAGSATTLSPSFAVDTAAPTVGLSNTGNTSSQTATNPGATSAVTVNASLPPPAGYSTAQLIFEDTFASASLDTTKWNPWLGDDTYGRWGDRGALPSPYSAENAGSYQIQYNDPYPYGSGAGTNGNHLGGGSGILQEVATPSGYFSSLGYSWASGAVSSYGKEYLPAEGGYLQISAKMPDSSYGAWGCLWLLPTAGSNGAEFDLQESGTYGTTGSSTANDILASHWWGGSQTQHTANTGTDLSAGYHTYGVEYRPGQSWKVYLDGNLMFTWTDGVSTNAAYQVIIELEMAGSSTAGWHTVADPVNHPGPFELDVNDVQIYSLANAPVPPPAPTNLTLAPASDSGGVGDNITDVTRPTITGQGEAGDGVTLFDGTSPVGSATVQTNGSWSLTTSSLSQGVNSLTATESNAAGTVSTASAALALTIDTTAPSLVADSPLSLKPGSTATITSSLLRFDDTVSSHAQETYTISTGPADGMLLLNGAATKTFTQNDIDNNRVTYQETTAGAVSDSFTFTVTDSAGNTTAVQQFQLSMSTAPPVSEVLVSDTGSSSTDKITSNPALTGGGDPNATVTIKEGSTVLGTTTANSAGVWSFTPVLADGSHTLVASETDLAGNTGTASLAFTLDTAPPAVAAKLASDTGSSSSDNITSNPALTGSGDPNATVTIKEGSTVLGTTTANASGVWSFTPVLANGSHTLVASETDLAGNTGTASLAFTLDTATPSLVADSPLTVRAGSTATITSSLLRFDDTVSSHAQETYTITSGPADGTLLLNGVATTSFTQDDIDNNRVAYQETASGATSDSFTFTVSDSAGNTTAAQQFQLSMRHWHRHAPTSGAATSNTQFGFGDISSPWLAAGGVAPAIIGGTPTGQGTSSHPYLLPPGSMMPLGDPALFQ